MHDGTKGVIGFVGTIGATLLVASGQLGDVNAYLQDLKGTPTQEPVAVALETTENPAGEALEQADATTLENTPAAEPKPEVAALPPEPTVADEPTETEADTEPSVEAPAEPGAGPADALAEIIIPSFDILRVEPDGSTLIAGQAAPDSAVEIVSGATVVAETAANAAGEFVALLEQPLAEGDHSLVIRATEDEGRSSTSKQTAIVAIPEDDTQGVLALVETPGEPSRLISTPQPGAPQLVPVAPQTQAVAVAEAPPQTEEPEPTPEIAANSNDDDGDTASPIAPGILALGEGTPLIAQDPIDDDPEQLVQSEQEPAETAAPVETAAVEAAPEPEVAETTKAPEPSSVNVAIEAVEIDGDKVFVAGSAEPGARLRVYANEILLGDTVASAGGRFLVEVTRDLPVGDYIIRADVLDPRNAEVVRRVAVPFARTAAERLAAVAVAPSVTLPNEAPAIDTDTDTALAPVTPAPDAAETETAPVQPSATRDVEVAAAQPEPQSSSTDTDTAIVPDIIATLDGAPQVPTEIGTLQPTDESVIIRRGDTLWQISRRVYGKGVKYTTIYLANQEQIRDPGRIWPGQIFAVPDEADDDAVALEKHQELRRSQ